ncbi:MAG: hypothetical protein JWQ78_1457 [Sediminibacterium sp.]|nr:hypothetical protein [Sediminibacterium sp.]
MKKLSLLLVALLILFCISSYLFIPSRINITSSAVMRASENSTERFALTEENWSKWWNSGQGDHGITTVPDIFAVKGDIFRLTEKFYKSAKINIRHGTQPLPSELVIIPLGVDSTGIQWSCSLESGANPFNRLSRYFAAFAIKKNMDTVLGRMQLFLSKKENVYGIHIARVSTIDTLLVTSKTVLSTYPNTPAIYELVKAIQAYAEKNGARQAGNPIYNVTRIDDTRFQLMTAVPIDKEIKANSRFLFKRMVRGSFMVTEVVGGEHTVEKAAQSLKQYFEDYRKTSMAIPFTMLVTDRVYQPDTSKWITKIYQPVY